MYAAPTSRRPLPLPALGTIGEQRSGPWMAEVNPGDLGRGVPALHADAKAELRAYTDKVRERAMASGCPQVRPISSSSPHPPGSARSIASSVVSQRAIERASPSGGRIERRRRPLEGSPWESYQVQQFAHRLLDKEAVSSSSPPSAMVLEGPSGTVLQAVGESADHKIAGQVIAEIQKQQHGSKGSASARDNPTTLVLGKPQAAVQNIGKVSFGAVYEHRDASGKAKLIGSTNILPERQLQLDNDLHSVVKDLSSKRGGGPGCSGQLVWVGIGAGPVGEQEMTRVRQAVVDSRADRFKIEKLGSEKPYSRHF